jgi:hypothetical protein
VTDAAWVIEMPIQIDSAAAAAAFINLLCIFASR